MHAHHTINVYWVVLYWQIYDKSMPAPDVCNVRIPVAHRLQPQEANYTAYNRYALLIVYATRSGAQLNVTYSA
jgi:hypothetical protein